MKSSCSIVPRSMYPDHRTVNFSGNSYQINARFCPRQFVKSTVLLCLNKYSPAERGEHKKARESNWGREDRVWQCLLIDMKHRAGECPEAPPNLHIPHPGGHCAGRGASSSRGCPKDMENHITASIKAGA